MYLADLIHPDETLMGKLYALYNLRTDKTIDLGFREPFLQLLEAFGNPHLHLPPTIHVAGTNGKGSCLATLRTLLEAQGKTVSAFTSPHLYQFNERLYASGTYIDNKTLEALIDEALDLNQGREVTFFEITTAMAFAYFARQKTDYCLLEVGMGGRLDCTNVIENPLATVITNISYDHQQFLGDTIEEIASEKAGIMKPGVPCISSPQLPEVETVLRQKAAEKGVSLTFSTPYDGVVNLSGVHQLENVGTALAALEMMEEKFSNHNSFPCASGGLETDGEKDPRFHGESKNNKSCHFARNDVILQALQNIHWPGRLENVSAKLGFPQSDIWYDGGCNDSAGGALAKQLQKWQAEDPKELHLILGMKGDKHVHAFLNHITPYVQSTTVVPIERLSKCLSASEVEGALEAADIMTALEALKPHHDKRILIAGSLYLAQQLPRVIPTASV